MISPVSFGSTYKVYASTNNIREQLNYSKMTNFCDEKGFQYESDIRPITTPSMYQTPQQIYTLTTEVPDESNKDVEAFCTAKGIKFHKFENKDILKPESIYSRIQLPPIGYKKVLVDADKLSEFLQTQTDNNFEHCEKDYQKFFKKRTDFMLKSADRIPAPTLYILPTMGHKNALEYIRTYGSDKLNENSVITDLSQRTEDPDHCLYFAMKDLGMKQIPVYVNRDTYEIGKALGLLK